MMLEAPASNLHLFKQYDIDYVYLSSYERRNYNVDSAWFLENCAIAFESGNVYLFEIPSGAQ